MRITLFAILLLAGCPTGGDPAPITPAPVDPPMGTGGATAPAPAGSPCEDACVHRAVMHCGGAGPGCVEACERYEAEAKTAPALAWNPNCQARASTCAAADACRSN